MTWQAENRSPRTKKPRTGTDMRRLRMQSKWLVQHVVESTGLTEAEAEQGILALIRHGYIRIIPNVRDNFDGFEVIRRSRRQSLLDSIAELALPDVGRKSNHHGN